MRFQKVRKDELMKGLKVFKFTGKTKLKRSKILKKVVKIQSINTV